MRKTGAWPEVWTDAIAINKVGMRPGLNNKKEEAV